MVQNEFDFFSDKNVVDKIILNDKNMIKIEKINYKNEVKNVLKIGNLSYSFDI